MAIADVVLTDTFDQWRQKTNLMIDKVNTLASNGDALSVSSPVSAQILVYDGTFFRNVSVTGDITIGADGSVTVLNGGGGGSKGRNYFSGSMRSIF
jgi:hypothetical protein